jgi:hypothetical protein
MDGDRFYQVLTLTLSDGRKVSYTGRYALKDSDKVVDVECSPPHQLPHGMVWDRLVNAGEELK